MYQSLSFNTQGKTSPPPTPLAIQEIRGLLEEFRELFSGIFDTAFFTQILEKTAYDRTALRELRSLANQQGVGYDNLFALRNGMESMESFIQFSRKYVQPYLRDLLGISGFYNQRPASEVARMERTVKTMFASTFARNLDRLEEIHSSLEKCRLKTAV